MKIRTKLTLRYTAVTAAVYCLLMIIVFLSSENKRQNEFYRDLKKEAITKANLFLENKVDPEVMHSIYMNNREFIDEVEVAIYDTGFNLLYHDANQIDLVKETPEMMQEILEKRSIEFYQEKYQVVGLLYSYKEKEYIITAVAYDGYGYTKLDGLRELLILLWGIGIVALAMVGYLFSKSALRPVSNIVKEVEKITASNLDARVAVTNTKDELGELVLTYNNMLNRIENSFLAQKMFVSNVSHELRTPMAALIGELEIALLKERTPEEYRKLIGNALNDSHEVIKLLEGLLNLAKADYLPEQIKMSEVRLDELLLDARELVFKINKAYKIELIFEQEADDDAQITVLGNEYLLRTAFVNLMENNCKFSMNHTSSVHISFWEKKSILRFTDTGIGVPQEDLPHIFTPFYRGKNKDFTRGNGIGMALVKKIIMIHKGIIRVNSKEGEGTVFILEFPHI